MKEFLKAWIARLAQTKPIRSLVGHLVYPTVAKCLLAEIQPDIRSPSGVAEALAWKIHSYLVLNEELRTTGLDCSMDGMRCDEQTRTRILDVVLRTIATASGDILEFGVYKGESILTFAERCPNRQVYGFDSFEGLPESWWTRPKGTFKTDLPSIDKPNVILVKGLFSETLPGFLKEWSGPTALIHVDCDLYQSTRDCLLLTLPRCQVGTVLLFDEYYNYSDFAQHEWLAWHEIQTLYAVKASCLAYDGRRAAFKIEAMKTQPLKE